MTPLQEPHTPLFQPPADDMLTPRQLWAINRFRMEVENLKSRRYGGRSKQHWHLMRALLKVLKTGLKLLGQYERCRWTAYDLRLRELDVFLPRLPKAFEGLTILHLSDLHLDGMPGLEQKALELWAGRDVDLCLLTGDYRKASHGVHRKALNALEILLEGISAREGTWAVLGNHDDCHMVQPMEAMGIRVLINESSLLERDGQRLRIIGTDDVHYYYTDLALAAMEEAGEECSIAMVHSPEFYREAAALGVDLYLCGHTHGGQVCLPGGYAPVRHLRRGRRFYKGCWEYGDMRGVTNIGLGTSGVPVRIFSRGEMLLLRLRRRGG